MTKTPSKKENKLTSTPRPSSKSSRIEAKAPVEPSNRSKGLTIVGIGASAGGLEALSHFFDALPMDTGMAFVVITHLHPEHESHMAELLQGHTRMPTMQVSEKTKVEANHVYVIPPNRSMLLTDTHLDTREFEEPHGKRMPIDFFFRSLAQSGHSDPIAIILSGGGTDGSVGIKDIKEVGGLIMVQQPDDAQYDSMPRAALTTGLVDVILPVDELPGKLVEYGQHRSQLSHDLGQLTDQESEIVNRILAQVHARTGHDFTHYKRSTVLRRIERRMQLSGFTTLETYLTFLRGKPAEAQAMFNDILIGVTNFFRDRDSWQAVEEKVIPQLFRRQGQGEVDAVRLWTIGCATGEEAYALAMLLFEEAAHQDVRTHIQIFASDLDERSIAYARQGLYPAAIEADVSPERLERFFTREGEYYRVKRELRDVVLFTNHNVLRDPPFSHLDLIACRNVLIYLQRGVQERVFDIFHYSLNPGGYLFLGSSESAEHLPNLFSAFDKNHRIYQAKPWTGELPHVPSMPRMLQGPARTHEPYGVSGRQMGRFLDAPVMLEGQHQRALESFGPPSVIVNERYAILHVSESAGRYLHQPKGPITGDLLALVRPELQLELRTALFHAFEKGQATFSRPVAVGFNGHRRRVVISVRPLSHEPGPDQMTDRQALVFFIEDEVVNPDELPEEMKPPRTQAERDNMVAQLQGEVQRLREQLEITVEEHASSDEEMKAANEELQSINEEYRSATEELETSKEELQSVNEELQTLNGEMRNKLDEISRAHRELENLMGATEIATLFLDRDLRIQRFSAGVQELFSMLKIDRGRRISDLTHKLGYAEFVEDAEQALRTLIPVEREVQTPDGNSLLIRLRPYRTMDDKIEGVVITFVDISRLKRVERELVHVNEMLEERVLERTHELDDANQKTRHARDLFQALFNANPIPTALIGLEDNTFLNVNTEFLAYFGLEPEAVINHHVQELNLSLGMRVESREGWLDPLRQDGRIRNYETEILHPSGEVRNIFASIQLLELDGVESLIGTFIDITDRVKAERQVRALASELTEAEQQERHRISQILHDDLQQRLFAIKAQLPSLEEASRKQDEAGLQDLLGELDDWLSASIAITRDLSVEISPIILHGEGLADAIAWLSTQMQKQYNLNLVLQTDGLVTHFSKGLRVMLFQAVRELMFNVVKHSGTLDAIVVMQQVDDRIMITVSDEGSGFDSASVMADPSKAHGLLSIRDRLDLLGCHLNISSTPGGGTHATIDCPNPGSAEEQ